MNAQALEALRSLLSPQALQTHAPAASELGELASALTHWSLGADLAAFRRATPHEELLYPLHVSSTGPCAYLVSDGTQSNSPPHEHQTWAVIVGIAGRELNRTYKPGPSGRLHAWLEQVVGPTDSLVLDATAIHSTVVVGAEPTFHIHVYGQALDRLPPFTARTFEAQ
jgi:predicted metal-dependent enzyme (double-stranded beta helix superfamily)